jgi:hypothetical protein
MLTRIRGPILDRMGADPTSYDARIFAVDRTPGGTFIVEEQCDAYFRVEITADELRALGQELIDAANSVERTPVVTVSEHGGQSPPNNSGQKHSLLTPGANGV